MYWPSVPFLSLMWPADPKELPTPDLSLCNRKVCSILTRQKCCEKSGSIRINVTSQGVDVAVSVVHWHGTKNRIMSRTSFFSREMNLEGCSWADFNQKIYAEAISFSCDSYETKLNHIPTNINRRPINVV